MAHLDSIKQFSNGGMDTDSSPNYVAPSDWIASFNTRNTGTTQGEAGVITNIDSNDLIAGTRSDGINQCIGAEGFESIRKAIGFIFNSGGFHQIVQYDIDTQLQTVLFTDKTDSANISILNLNPQYYIQIKLVNDIYLVWSDGINPVGFTNLNTLSSGGYGVVQAEDFSLLKPQGLPPIIGEYSSDQGKAANFVKGNLFQFNYQFVGQDFTYSAWSTWSKRIIPEEESTPEAGSDVRANNCIIVSVGVGSIRTLTINIAARSANLDFGVIKSVDRAYVLLLPNTSIDIDNEIYEAYDPSTGLYSFIFYNDSISIPVPATQTDEPYDAVPHAATGLEIINGNIIGLADLFEGYDRPIIDVIIQSVGYNPNINIPNGPADNPMYIFNVNPGASGSGAGDHRRKMGLSFGGVPHTNDKITVVIADIRDSNNTNIYPYTVPAGQDGDLGQVVSHFSEVIPGSNFFDNHDGTYTINFTGPSYFGLQSATITLFHAGPDISKSIHALLDNSSYQLALRYRNTYGQYFPLVTGNQFITKTQSFAQLEGNTPQISVTINTAEAPIGAVDYEILITPNSTVSSLLDVMGTLVNYKGTWDAHTNMPALASGSGTVGQAYQITTPSTPDDNRNLGNGNVNFNTGDYVLYNGKSWDVISKNFADMTGTGNTLVFKINPLDLFNQKYADAGSPTVLTYGYSAGDRFTLHYYIDGTTPIYVNSPCVDLQVLGYDSGTFLVKVEKSSTFDEATIVGKNSYFRLYSPKKAELAGSSVQNGTVWYEIGQRYTITNGLHDTLNITVTDGDVYFKTRSYNGAIDPTELYPVLATDFNFSDFYVSAYTSYGRPGSYNDVLETTERKASIRYSHQYILGSKNNGLTKFYAANIYGDGDGQTSSSFGAIQIMWQRGNILLVFQELNVGYVPVFISIIEDNIEQQQVAISEKLLNTARYERGDIAIGRAKESFSSYNDIAYFVDPNRCEPCHATTGGVFPISGKMSKFFKTVLQSAFDNHQKVTSYYDRFNNEWVVTVQTLNKVVISFAFNALNWQVLDDYIINPSDVTATTNGAHSTVSYNNTTGVATYTPTSGYIGNDVATFTFNVSGTPITKNVCLNWIAGNTDVNPFSFAPLVDVPVNTLEASNTISVGGINIAVPISITGGQYSVNGGAFTSSAGTVVNGDIIQVRQTSSASHSTETDTVLTISSTSATFKVTTIGTEDVNPFAFTPQTNVNTSTVYVSNSITVSGNTIPAPISITGGEYSKNGGSYTSVSGTVNAGDTVTVRQTSSGSFNTPTSCTLNIDSQSGVFTVTTGTILINPISFTAQTGVVISTDIISNSVTISGNTLPAPIHMASGSLGSYSVNGGVFTTASGSVNAGDTVRVKVTSSGSYNTLVQATLIVDGQSPTFSTTTQFVNTFSFTPQTEVTPSTVITSNTITVAGNSVASVPISVTGGTYSINGGAYTSTSGTVNIGDTVTLRGTSSASPETTTNVSLTILDKTGAFSITTYHVLTINLTLSEQADPYSDANGVGHNGGVPIFRETGNGVYHYIVQSRLSLQIEAFTELPSTGSNPTKTMEIKRNGSTIYGPTTGPNNVGDPNLSYTETGVDDAIYDVTISAAADAPIDPVSCGIPVTYSGGTSYPTDTIIDLGTGTGNVPFYFDAQDIPDKAEAWFDGVKVIDTGYRGNPSYQSALDAALAAMGLPPEPIIPGGLVDTYFTKSTTSTTCLVQIYAPLPDTSWGFNLGCPADSGDSVIMTEEISPIDRTTGNMDCRFNIDISPGANISIAYSIGYVQNGVLHDAAAVGTATITSPALTCPDIPVSFTPESSGGPLTAVIFTFTPTPNPVSTYTIFYDSPNTVAV